MALSVGADFSSRRAGRSWSLWPLWRAGQRVLSLFPQPTGRSGPPLIAVVRSPQRRYRGWSVPRLCQVLRHSICRWLRRDRSAINACSFTAGTSATRLPQGGFVSSQTDREDPDTTDPSIRRSSGASGYGSKGRPLSTHRRVRSNVCSR